MKAKYKEPMDFFPKEIRKEFGLGEFNIDTQEQGGRQSKPRSEKASPAPKSTAKKTK